MSEETEQLEDSQKDKYLTFYIGDEGYAIDIYHVTEIIGIQKITDVPQTPDYIKGVFNLRGRVLPVMDVRLRFQMIPRDYDERTCVIVANCEDNTIGLVVDRVSEVLDIPAASVEPSPHISQHDGNGDRFICGMGKVGKEIKMIIDINSLLLGSQSLEVPATVVDEVPA
jgi:purine-binding chemotaxis protein CheW